MLMYMEGELGVTLAAKANYTEVWYAENSNRSRIYTMAARTGEENRTSAVMRVKMGEV